MKFMLLAMGLGITILLIAAFLVSWMAGKSEQGMDEIINRETGGWKPETGEWNG